MENLPTVRKEGPLIHCGTTFVLFIKHPSFVPTMVRPPRPPGSLEPGGGRQGSRDGRQWRRGTGVSALGPRGISVLPDVSRPHHLSGTPDTSLPFPEGVSGEEDRGFLCSRTPSTHRLSKRWSSDLRIRTSPPKRRGTRLLPRRQP